ncbi:MAG: energy transducer TonB [Prevotella sp.]|nr:energy transducer TonB [Prevotella sp.]
MMNILLVYSLKSALMLTLLYLPYTLMLRHESFFRLNRLILVAVLLLALVQPLCKVTSPESLTQMPMIADSQEMVHQMETVIVGNVIETAAAPTWGWQEWLTLVYMVGIAFMLCLRICQLVQIRWALRCGCLWRQLEEDGVFVCCHVGNSVPFSWMRSIYISETDYNQNGRAILLHERAHIHLRHSIDILLLIVVEAVQWWNPVIYLLGRSLRNVHEYEADNYVLRQGVSLSDYQSLLVRKALADTAYAFANNFNRSHILKRIEMMNRAPSNPWLRAKALYVVPLLLFTFVISATPMIEPLLIVDGEEVGYDRVSQLQGDNISHVTVLKGVSATAIYGEKGKGGAVQIETKQTHPQPLPAERGEETLQNNSSNPDDQVFVIAEEMPKFPGGDAAFDQYMAYHVRYPKAAAENGVGGTVKVQFIVEPDGRITHVHAIDSPSGEADAVVNAYGASGKQPSQEEDDEGHRALREAAEELYRGMPPFEPGRQNGMPVRVQMTRTVNYSLK